MIRMLLLSMLAATPVLAADTGPRQCLSLPRVSNQRVVDGAILYRTGKQWFRNDMGEACTALKPKRSIQTLTPTSRLCAGNIVRVFDARLNIDYGSCALGTFAQVDAPGPVPATTGR